VVVNSSPAGPTFHAIGALRDWVFSLLLLTVPVASMTKPAALLKNAQNPAMGMSHEEMRLFQGGQCGRGGFDDKLRVFGTDMSEEACKTLCLTWKNCRYVTLTTGGECTAYAACVGFHLAADATTWEKVDSNLLTAAPRHSPPNVLTKTPTVSPTLAHIASSTHASQQYTSTESKETVALLRAAEDSITLEKAANASNLHAVAQARYDQLISLAKLAVQSDPHNNTSKEFLASAMGAIMGLAVSEPEAPLDELRILVLGAGCGPADLGKDLGTNVSAQTCRQSCLTSQSCRFLTWSSVGLCTLFDACDGIIFQDEVITWQKLASNLDAEPVTTSTEVPLITPAVAPSSLQSVAMSQAPTEVPLITSTVAPSTWQNEATSQDSAEVPLITATASIFGAEDQMSAFPVATAASDVPGEIVEEPVSSYEMRIFMNRNRCQFEGLVQNSSIGGMSPEDCQSACLISQSCPFVTLTLAGACLQHSECTGIGAFDGSITWEKVMGN